LILALPARAKLNLSLAVTGIRSDGYHEVDSLLQAVDLHDLLEAEPATESALEVAEGEAPAGADNLVLKALAELERAAGRPLPTRFRLHKRIPAGSGLGGGSSDAATALRLAAALHRVDIGAAAAAVGADVPFFLCGGAARATGRGEVLEPRATSAAWFALAWPGFELSTAEVYARWNEVGGEGANQLTRAAQVVDPRLAEFAEQLGQGWQMSGSGSAFFTPCATATEAEERRRQAPHGVWTATARAVARWC
jgi:4-diphosphocytidyl-2-C-methyl-D-erythritol kinase